MEMNDIKTMLVHQDEHYVILNKPPGLLSQPGLSEDTALLTLSEQLIGKKLHLLNRLDRPVSGLVAMSLRSNGNEFWGKAIKKYIAVTTKGKKKEETLNHFIHRNGKYKKAFISPTKRKGYKPCTLTYTVLKTLDHVDIVEVTLASGKFHQIRAQLAFIGRHIRGDVKYGARRSNKDRSIDLHASHLLIADRQLSLTCPAMRDTPLWQEINSEFLS